MAEKSQAHDKQVLHKLETRRNSQGRWKWAPSSKVSSITLDWRWKLISVGVGILGSTAAVERPGYRLIWDGHLRQGHLALVHT